MSNDGIYFQCMDLKFCMLYDEVFCICEKYHKCIYCNSNLVRFEKHAAKTLQHGQRYGDIFMLPADREPAHTG